MGRGTKDFVVYVKVNWQPLTNIWDQSNFELATALFVCFSYAQNRSLDQDLFCGESSTRLLSAVHILCNSFRQRTMTKMSISWGQSRIQYHNSYWRQYFINFVWSSRLDGWLVDFMTCQPMLGYSFHAEVSFFKELYSFSCDTISWIYTHTCIHTCVCALIHVCVCVCVCVYIYIYIYTSTCMCVYAHTHTYTHIYMWQDELDLARVSNFKC